MKRFAVLAALAVALAAPAAAVAHPLGNFTINRFSRIEISGHRLYVVYVLDLAEIPTFQAGMIDPRAYARRILHDALRRGDSPGNITHPRSDHDDSCRGCQRLQGVP